MPVVLVRLEKGKYVLTTGNLILNSHVGDLKDKLDKINSIGKEGLKTLFYDVFIIADRSIRTAQAIWGLFQWRENRGAN